MILDAKQRALFVQVFGEEMVQAIEQTGEEKTAELEAAGVRFKSHEPHTISDELGRYIREELDAKHLTENDAAGILANIQPTKEKTMDNKDTLGKIMDILAESVYSEKITLEQAHSFVAALDQDDEQDRIASLKSFLGCDTAEREPLWRNTQVAGGTKDKSRAGQLAERLSRLR